MMCDECGIRPATIRLMSIVGGEKIARNLCAHCLADVKKTLPSLDLSGLDGMLASLLAATKKMSAGQPAEIDITCPRCNTTYAAFQQSGVLGCADCYQAFHEPLSVLLKRIHGQTQHMGRRPGSTGEHIAQKLNVMNLRQQLAKAIDLEEYEQAASLRDRIREITGELGAQASSAPKKEASMHDGL